MTMPPKPNSDTTKELVVEVRIKWDELMSKDELHILTMFSERAEDAIKRKVVTEVVERIVNELPLPEIDLTDLKERIKAGIVERKIDEVLEND